MVCQLTLYELFVWAPTTPQVTQWNPELPFARTPVEPKVGQEMDKSKDSGGQGETWEICTHETICVKKQAARNEVWWISGLQEINSSDFPPPGLFIHRL